MGEVVSECQVVVLARSNRSRSPELEGVELSVSPRVTESRDPVY